ESLPARAGRSRPPPAQLFEQGDRGPARHLGAHGQVPRVEPAREVPGAAAGRPDPAVVPGPGPVAGEPRGGEPPGAERAGGVGSTGHETRTRRLHHARSGIYSREGVLTKRTPPRTRR